jgi:hypothetical protein
MVDVRHGGCKNIVVGKPERKRPLERPRHKCKDGINMGLREI